MDGKENKDAKKYILKHIKYPTSNSTIMLKHWESSNLSTEILENFAKVGIDTQGA